MRNVKDIAKEIAKLNSTEINELSSILMNDHNISATIYRFGSLPTTDSTSTHSNNQDCDLILLETGSLRLAVVKLIKEQFGLGLKEAKDLMESAPCYLKEFLPLWQAQIVQEQFEEIGATVEIRIHGE